MGANDEMSHGDLLDTMDHASRLVAKAYIEQHEAKFHAPKNPQWLPDLESRVAHWVDDNVNAQELDLTPTAFPLWAIRHGDLRLVIRLERA